MRFHGRCDDVHLGARKMGPFGRLAMTRIVQAILFLSFSAIFGYAIAGSI